MTDEKAIWLFVGIFIGLQLGPLIFEVCYDFYQKQWFRRIEKRIKAKYERMQKHDHT